MQKRFIRWAEAGVWDRLFGDLVRDRKNPYLMLDSTIVRAHRHGRKTGRRQGSGAFPGGLSTNIDLLANGLGEPIAFRLTGPQVRRSTPLLAGRQAEIVMADRGYDSSAIVAAIEAIGAEAVIPSKINRKVRRPTIAHSINFATASNAA